MPIQGSCSYHWLSKLKLSAARPFQSTHKGQLRSELRTQLCSSERNYAAHMDTAVAAVAGETNRGALVLSVSLLFFSRRCFQNQALQHAMSMRHPDR